MMNKYIAELLDSGGEVYVQMQGDSAYLAGYDGAPIAFHVLDYDAIGILLWGDEYGGEDARYFIPWGSIRALHGTLTLADERPPRPL